MILKAVEMERKKKNKTPQEIGFLCLYYCKELKEEHGVPVMELELPAWCSRGCRVIHVDGSGLEMARTTLR